MTPSFAIVRATDGRAVMDGTNLCSVRWGTDPARVRTYDSLPAALQSLELLTDADDCANAATWCAAREHIASSARATV